MPRGFFVWTDNIWDQTTWSDPVYYDVNGIDQDVRIYTAQLMPSCSLTMMGKCT